MSTDCADITVKNGISCWKLCKKGDMVSISGEKAGLHFLMTVHTDLSESAVMERAKSRGIKLAALSGYYHGERPPENVYVMHYSSIDVDRANEIMNRLYKSCT